MAITKHQYNHTATCFANGTFESTGTYALELLKGATFNATHISKSQVDNSGAYEVYSNDWTQGGTILSSYVQVSNTHDAIFGSSNVSIMASSNTIGPANSAIIYNIETEKPIMFYDFGEDRSAGIGTEFKVNFGANGIIRWISTTV